MPDSIRSEIEIDAPTTRVFRILTELDRYPEWNPFTPRVRSSLAVGDLVWLGLAVGRIPFVGWRWIVPWPERVRAFEPDRSMRWGLVFGWRGFFAAERIQRLEPIDADRTRYISEDRMTGLLAPLVMALFGGRIQAGFDEVALALKKRAESPDANPADAGPAENALEAPAADTADIVEEKEFSDG